MVTVSSCILPSDSTVNVAAFKDCCRKGIDKSSPRAMSHCRWKIWKTNILFIFRFMTNRRNTSTLFPTLSQLSWWFRSVHGFSSWVSLQNTVTGTDLKVLPWTSVRPVLSKLKTCHETVPDWQRGNITVCSRI